MNTTRSDSSSRLRVIAPLGVRFSAKSVLDETGVEVTVEKRERITPKEIGLSIIASLSNGSIIGVHKPINELSEATDEYTIRGNISLPVTTSKVTLIATYRDVEVDHLELFGKARYNLRLAIPEVIVY